MAEALDILQGRVAEMLALQRSNAENCSSEDLSEARKFKVLQQQQLQAVETQVEQLRKEPRGPTNETYQSFWRRSNSNCRCFSNRSPQESRRRSPLPVVNF